MGETCKRLRLSLSDTDLPGSLMETTCESHLDGPSITVEGVFPRMTPSGVELLIKTIGDMSTHKSFRDELDAQYIQDPHNFGDPGSSDFSGFDPYLPVPNSQAEYGFHAKPQEPALNPSGLPDFGSENGSTNLSNAFGQLTASWDKLAGDLFHGFPGSFSQTFSISSVFPTPECSPPGRSPYIVKISNEEAMVVQPTPLPPVENISGAYGEEGTDEEIDQVIGEAVSSAVVNGVSSDFARHSMAGKYGFNVHFPEANGNIWIYRPEDRKLFVKMNTDFDVDFQFQKCPSLPFTIEAAAYHHDKGVFGDAVNVCVKHLPTGRNDPRSKLFLYSEKSASHLDGKVVIKVTKAPPKKGSGYHLVARYRCRCNNSCFRAKAVIGLVFQVKQQGRVLAQSNVEIRSCACPARDAALKKADGIEKRGRKAKKRPIDAVSPETHPPINGKEEGRVGVVIEQEEGVVSTSRSNSSGIFPILEADFSGHRRPKFEKSDRGIFRQYYRDGSALRLDMKMCVDGSYEAILNTQLASLEQTMSTLHKVNLQPGKKVSIKEMVHPRVGMRTRVELPSKYTPFDEIRCWMHDVVRVRRGLSPYLFLDENLRSLDDIFSVSKQNLERILVELNSEVIEKFWHFIQKKERPLRILPYTQSSASQSQ